MAEYTTNFSLPYPEGDDDVAVHSDIEELAKAVDTRVSGHIADQSDRIASAENNLGTLNQDVEDLERTRLPRAEAEQYGIPGSKGDKGDKGDPGKQGIPGVEAVPSDEAVAAYLGGDETHTRVMADSMYPSRAEFDAVETLAGDATLRHGDELVEGNWTFSKGHTSLSNTARVGVHRTFDKSKGDLFDSDVRLEAYVSSQASTNQNPPGYNIASISLVEDGEHGEQYQGETATLDFVSNRFRMNRRLEIRMGTNTGRATLASGAHPGNQYARLSLHNASHPRLDLYGPNNESHNGTRKSLMVVDGARLDIRSGEGSAQRWENEDQEGKSQRLEVIQFGVGHQAIRGNYDGQSIGGIRWRESGSVELYADHKIRLLDPVEVRGDLEHSRGTGVVLNAPDGQKFRIAVTNAGDLITEEV